MSLGPIDFRDHEPHCRLAFQRQASRWLRGRILVDGSEQRTMPSLTAVAYDELAACALPLQIRNVAVFISFLIHLA